MDQVERCKQILNRRYVVEGNSYLAGGEVLRELSKHARSIQIKSGKTTAEFLVCDNHVLYTKTVAYHRKHQIATNQLDVMRTCTTVKASKTHIQAVLNKREYRNCILAINIGNLQHDMAIFMKKGVNGSYQFIHYDPNQGATSQITTKFVQQFGTKCSRYGYHADDGNIQGNCTQLAWIEILKFMLLRENPFERVDLKRFCSITKTYLSTSEYEQVKERTRVQNQLYESTKRKR